MGGQIPGCFRIVQKSFNTGDTVWNLPLIQYIFLIALQKFAKILVETKQSILLKTLCSYGRFDPWPVLLTTLKFLRHYS